MDLEGLPLGPIAKKKLGLHVGTACGSEQRREPVEAAELARSVVKV
jgi:hypothetical protein